MFFRRLFNQNTFYILQGVLIGVIAAAVPVHAMMTPAQDHSVSIVEFSFNPPEKTVAVGDTVTWTNQDGASHNVTATDSSWGSSTLIPGMNITYTQTFTQTGVFNYLCTIHPSMTGTITVAPVLGNQLYLPLVARNP